MKGLFRHKRILISLPILVGAITIYLITNNSGRLRESEITRQPDSSVIQTGKAFEVIEPSVKTNSDLSGKTAAELILEADQLVIATDQLIKTSGLDQVAMSIKQKQQIDDSVNKLVEQINELEQQLK